jgi:tRNA threonylcarbamoyladenosine biosynthesis protein TsaB
MNSAPLILSLETATLGGSIFLARGTNALASRNGDPKVSHSNSLLADINDCLSDAEVKLEDLELFACASGPGSFTGLRIGIATMKGLAATLNRPCAGVPTLNAIAHSAGTSNATVALLPAGRGEVFAQMFSVAGDEVIELDSAAHLSPLRLIERYGDIASLIWAGPGVEVHRTLLQQHAGQHDIEFVTQPAGSDFTQNCWRLAPPTTNLAQHVSVLALILFSLGQTLDAGSLKAIYVRPSDAEINQPWR